MPIYTRTGDSGKTRTLRGSAMSKAEPVIAALGSLDELNSLLGLLASFLNTPDSKKNLNLILSKQAELLKCGTMLALSGTKYLKQDYPLLINKDVVRLESEMDAWEKELPELKHFIIPGGSTPAALAHHARSVCRRAEREIVRLNEHTSQDPLLLRYLNRLSDWLFVFARILAKGKELVWRQGQVQESRPGI